MYDAPRYVARAHGRRPSFRIKDESRGASIRVSIAVFFGKKLCVEKLHNSAEDLKAHLPSERHQTGRLARFAHCKLTTPEREPEEGPQASGEYLFYETKELHTCTEEEETSTSLH